MKFLELKKKSPADLQKEWDNIKLDLMKFRAQIATGGAGKEAGKIKELKRTLARIKTLQHEEVKSKK